MNDKISKERLKWITETDPLKFMGTKVFIRCAEERYALARELIALRTAAEGLEKALGHMIREWCEIIGDETVNSTPADTLENARTALDAYRKVMGK